MAQMTVRAEAELVERVRHAARAAGRSMNDYVAFVLDVATNPDLAGTEAERLRERLRRADLLIPPAAWRPAERPTVDRDRLREAGARAATGTPVAELVQRGR